MKRVSYDEYLVLHDRLLDLASKIEKYDYNTCPAVIHGIYEDLCTQLWHVTSKMEWSY